MGDFEDTIVAALDLDRLGVLAFVFTHTGAREWHFYVGDVDQVGAASRDGLGTIGLFLRKLGFE